MYRLTVFVGCLQHGGGGGGIYDKEVILLRNMMTGIFKLIWINHA